MPGKDSLAIPLVLATGMGIAALVGILQYQGPFGDDSIYYVGAIKSLASTFPMLGWDPHFFSGYRPAIGLSWITYLPPVILVWSGLDATSAFHISFVCVFLLYGLSVFYFTRTVGCGPLVSYGLSILAWSTNAYWNLSIWGGAYNRIFTVPVMFVALATTYRYGTISNDGGSAKRTYWACILTWSLLLLGDVFVAAAGLLIGLLFLIFSTGLHKIIVGLRRVFLVFVPVVGLTSWQTIPIVIQTLLIGSSRNVYTVPDTWSWLLVPGDPWRSTLNYVLLPSIAALTFLAFLLRVKYTEAQRGLFLSLLIIGSYWFVMGWIPQAWRFIPRLMATNSSVENIAWIGLMGLGLLISGISARLAKLSIRVDLLAKLHKSLNLKTIGFSQLVQVLILAIIIANAVVVMPTIVPVNWQPLNNQLNDAISANTNSSSVDYRVSLSNRYLTRSQSYYQPNLLGTGGRIGTLNPNPFYNNWYATDVFYKNDLDSITQVYVDDRPAVNVSSLLGSRQNFATNDFWLDWMGVGSVVFFPYYKLSYTIGNYSIRPALFSTESAPTAYSIPVQVVQPLKATPILIASNATVIGFYSTSADATGEYAALIAILSDLGLGPRYVVPVYLRSLESIPSVGAKILLTDDVTYSRNLSEILSQEQLQYIVVASTQVGDITIQPTVEQTGTKSLVRLAASLGEIATNKESGSLYFINSAPFIKSRSISAANSTYQVPQAIPLAPNSWSATYRTRNAMGSLQAGNNYFVLNLTSTDITAKAQFNLDSVLPSSIPLSPDLVVRFYVKTTHPIGLGVSFKTLAKCCPNYVGLQQLVQNDTWSRFELAFSEFNTWGNSTMRFGLAQDLTLAVNLPAGTPTTEVSFANVTLSSPAYSTSVISTPVSLSNDGIIVYHGGGLQALLLANDNGESTGSLVLAENSNDFVIPLASLYGAVDSQKFDRLFLIGQMQGSLPTITLFESNPWSSIHTRWDSNTSVEASSIARGFSGIIWKETYASDWVVQDESAAGNTMMSYYYAGPGMIYIRTSSPTSRVRISYASLNITFLVTISILVADILALALLYLRFPDFPMRSNPRSLRRMIKMHMPA